MLMYPLYTALFRAVRLDLAQKILIFRGALLLNQAVNLGIGIVAADHENNAMH